MVKMSILELVQALREIKGLDRDAQLQRLGEIGGIYVPALYPLKQTATRRMDPRYRPSRHSQTLGGQSR